MKAVRSARRTIAVLMLMAAGALAGAGWLEAHTTPRPTAKPTPSAPAGRFCGGNPHTAVSLKPDFAKECKVVYGQNASAVNVTKTASGWMCRIAGKRDAPPDPFSACWRSHGQHALAALVGIGPEDWRCIRPQDVNGHVIPVLLLPRDKLKPSEVKFVADTVKRLEAMMGGVRRFYAGHASKPIKGTNAFVLVTDTSASDWQKVAKSTAVPPTDPARWALHKEITRELEAGGWTILAQRAKVKIGGFVTVGSSPTEDPSWLGAAGDEPGIYFSLPPLVSTAACDPTKPNPDRYEWAFHTTAHEFGHTLGLKQTEEYKLTRPPDWEQSVMQHGKGTHSKLFEFEKKELEKFLKDWP